MIIIDMTMIVIATRSSKITVECTGMSARQLPVGIDRVTQVRLTLMVADADGVAVCVKLPVH